MDKLTTTPYDPDYDYLHRRAREFAVLTKEKRTKISQNHFLMDVHAFCREQCLVPDVFIGYIIRYKKAR